MIQSHTYVSFNLAEYIHPQSCVPFTWTRDLCKIKSNVRKMFSHSSRKRDFPSVALQQKMSFYLLIVYF